MATTRKRSARRDEGTANARPSMPAAHAQTDALADEANTAAAAKPGSGTLVLERGQRVRLADQLYGQIFEQIVEGGFNVGDKLPSEHEICERYGVSRPVVREALLRLRADGLVTAHQGLGTFVSYQPAPRLKTFSDVQNVGAYLRAQEIRVALEGDAARLAALRRTDEELHQIAQAHAAFVDQLERGHISAQADLAFHACIAQATGNDYYLGVLESIHESINGFMRLTLSLTRTGSRQRAQRVVDEHAAILAAIREQDGERARVAMQFHLGQARHRLVDRERDQ